MSILTIAVIAALATSPLVSPSGSQAQTSYDDLPTPTIVYVAVPVIVPGPTLKERVVDVVKAVGNKAKAAGLKTGHAINAGARKTGRGIVKLNHKIQPAVAVAQTVMTLSGCYYFIRGSFTHATNP